MNNKYNIEVISNTNNNSKTSCDVDVMKIDGHVYVIASRYHGGVSIIHAESCPCKHNQI